MKRKNKKIFSRAIRFNCSLIFVFLFFYISLGYFSDWSLLFGDMQEKGRVAGASVSATLRIWGLPSEPNIIANSRCNNQGQSYINLSWAPDENSINYDIYRNNSELVLGVTNNFFNDEAVSGSEEYSYYVIANGYQESATSEVIIIPTKKCSTMTPFISVTKFNNKDKGSYKDNPETTERRPYFQGQTNIKNATIEIEIYSSSIFYGTTVSNDSGYWQWRVPEDLKYGNHTAYFSVSQNGKIVAKYFFKFRVVKEEGEGSQNDDKNEEVSILNNNSSHYPIENQTLDESSYPIKTVKPFDFEVDISNDSYVKGVAMNEEFYRGEDLELEILFTDIINESQRTNIKYRLYSLDQKMILEYEDEIYPTRGQKLIKKIPIPYDLDLGKYKIQTSITIDNIIVSHENYFVLKDRPVMIVGSTHMTYNNLIKNIGSALIICVCTLLILILLAIWEHHLAQKALYQITATFLKKKGFIN